MEGIEMLRTLIVSSVGWRGVQGGIREFDR